MTRIKLFLYWVLAVIPLITSLIIMPGLPESVPLKYGFNGEISRYGSKYELFILPAMTLFIAGLMYFLYKAYARKSERMAQNGRVLISCGWILGVCFGILSLSMLYYTKTGATNINETYALKLISIVLCVMFILLGNLLPKCKRNGSLWWAVGFRTPWTLSDDEVWTKTNRLGGFWMVGIGVIGIILSILLPGLTAIIIITALLILVAVGGIIYSWALYRKIHVDS